MSSMPFSTASFSNLPLMETLYQQYSKDPASVDPSWRAFFDGFEFGGKMGGGEASPELKVYALIEGYRTYGHLLADFNPIAKKTSPEVPELDLKHFGFSAKDLNVPVPTCGFLKEKEVPLQRMIDALRKTYCNRIGIEYMGLGNPQMEAWVQKKIEPHFELPLSKEEKLFVFDSMNKAELFEAFIHTKYTGQTRFSLEGCETFIPVLSTLVETGALLGLSGMILGMAHRGRLNVLANILGKSYGQIFNEFEAHYEPDVEEGSGDVKYHKGFAGTVGTRSSKSIHFVLTPNPSHLEAVDPVVEGQARAEQQRKSAQEILPVLVHGDAALAGQGVIYETLQLCKLRGYSTGGTLHIVINNQIGFTTLPQDSRSTLYCTDIAKGFGAPVFHVNAEDPQGCVQVAKLALELRQQFGCDVFIDINGYRKYGHNEGDEPMFTQPLEYQLIKNKKSIREIYREQLIQEGVITEAQAQEAEAQFKESLRSELEAQKSVPPKEEKPAVQAASAPIVTRVPAETLLSLARTFCTVPSGFNIHPKIQRLLGERLAMVTGDPKKPTIDWGMGEHLAFATILNDQIHIRLSGQDCRRGTFSHRHALWMDQVNAAKYFPLSHLKQGQGLFDVFNSPLSEYAVLGFEFGYSLMYPEALIIWEAQYGDFDNGAQIIIDQFVTSSEQKWSHKSSLTLMLPHGYEGAGPEHSSGRIERFLQLAGNDNMQIVNCSNPAQLFHVLRRQALSPVKKPLILFTPKALLRHPLFVSPLSDFTSGAFQEMLDDPAGPLQPKKLILCSGKVYYDLTAEREKRKAEKLVLVRIDQLYPFNTERLQELLKKYAGFEHCLWVQEEHSNMGAWEYIRPLLTEALQGKCPLKYVGRERSASPAAGSYALHKKQLAALLEDAFR